MARISEETKLLEGRGTGHGANYIPWTKSREFNSKGTSSLFKDWKHGRPIELLSQGELWLYTILRWDDHVVDIREQYPMDPDVIAEEASKLGYRPTGGGKVIPVDMLVDYDDGRCVAYSVKNSRKDIEFTGDKEKDKRIRRTIEKLQIEKAYWNRQGIEYMLVFKEDLSRTVANNIMDVVWWYDPNEVVDDISAVKCLIAHKHITVDMGKFIDYRKIAEELRRKGNGRLLDGISAWQKIQI